MNPPTTHEETHMLKPGTTVHVLPTIERYGGLTGTVVRPEDSSRVDDGDVLVAFAEYGYPVIFTADELEVVG